MIRPCLHQAGGIETDLGVKVHLQFHAGSAEDESQVMWSSGFDIREGLAWVWLESMRLPSRLSSFPSREQLEWSIGLKLKETGKRE